jgi:(E)-4-hydroxy-3-methylbut-2-enyl-diphosphate synthase
MHKKQIMVGHVQVGGGAPVALESMTTTKTSDVSQTIAQIQRLAELGCDIIRVAVLDKQSARAIGEIKKHTPIPLIADIHFDYRLALLAIEAGADKIRINPGNIGDDANVRAITKLCNEKAIPIRIGVNSGSLSSEILSKYGGVTAEALIESALGHTRLLNKFDFDDICISAKTSSVPLTIAVYKMLHERTDYPLHVGVTEAGTTYTGIIKSAIGIGSLLAEGIGDTIRVSLTASPEEEIRAGIAILKAFGLRPGFELISCPTCGRCSVDLIQIATKIERHLHEFERQHNAFNRLITVAVMGCAVNGPGEASRADYGISAGTSEGTIFKKGRIIKKMPMESISEALISTIKEEERIDNS